MESHQSQYILQLHVSIIDLWKAEQFCDVRIATRDSPPCLAHSIILAAASETLCSDIQRSQLDKSLTELKTLSKYTKSEIDCLLQFLYTGEAMIPIGESMAALLELFHRLKLGHTRNKRLLVAQNRPSFARDVLDEPVEMVTSTKEKLKSVETGCSLEVSYQLKTSNSNGRELDRPPRGPTPLSRKDHLLRSQKISTTESQSPIKQTQYADEATSVQTPPAKRTRGQQKKNILETKEFDNDISIEQTLPEKAGTIKPIKTRACLIDKRARESEQQFRASLPEQTGAPPNTVVVSSLSITEDSELSESGPKRRVLTKAERKHLPTKIIPSHNLDVESELDTESESTLDSSGYIIKLEIPRERRKGRLADLQNQVTTPPNRSKDASITSFTKVKERIYCDECTTHFVTKESYESHLPTCSKIPSPALNPVRKLCKKCGKEFETNSNLNRHQKSCNGKPMKDTFSCKPCNMKFANEEKLNLHISRHNRTEKVGYGTSNKVKCEICERRFRNEKRKITHMATAHSVPLETNTKFPVYWCQQEGCKFKTLFDFVLKNHMKIHGEFRAFMCDICSKTFKQKNGLDTHMKNVHQQHSKKLSCDVCGKELKTSTALKIHIRRVHNQEKRFKCSECPFETFERASFETHLHAKHAIPHPKNKTQYSCAHCPFVTRWKNQYATHLRRHTGDTPFHCGVCGKNYTNKSELTSHKKWHMEKEHKCTHGTCKFATTTASKLTKHIRQVHTHRHIKPYGCEVCGYRTNVNGNLLAHLRKVHKLNPTNKQRLVKQLGHSENDETLQTTDNTVEMTTVTTVSKHSIIQEQTLNPPETVSEQIPLYHSQEPDISGSSAKPESMIQPQQHVLEQPYQPQEQNPTEQAYGEHEQSINVHDYAAQQASLEEHNYQSLAGGEVSAVLEYSLSAPIGQQVIYYPQSDLNSNAPNSQIDVYTQDNNGLLLPRSLPPSYMDVAGGAALDVEGSGFGQLPGGLTSFRQVQATSGYLSSPQLMSSQVQAYLSNNSAPQSLPVHSVFSQSTAGYDGGSLPSIEGSATRELPQHQSLISMLPASHQTVSFGSGDTEQAADGLPTSLQTLPVYNPPQPTGPISDHQFLASQPPSVLPQHMLTMHGHPTINMPDRPRNGTELARCLSQRAGPGPVLVRPGVYTGQGTQVLSDSQSQMTILQSSYPGGLPVEEMPPQ